MHRRFDVGDHRLQFVEKAVEPAHQLTQFVFAGIVQATGQVAFTAGDVFEHCRNLEDRPGHAASGHPDHQQAQHDGTKGHQQAGEVGVVVVGVQAGIELDGRRLQDLFGHFQQHAPRLRAGHRGERLADLEHAVGAEFSRLARAHLRRQGAGLLAEHVFDFLAQLAAIAAVSGEQAGGADDADLTVAVEQFPTAVEAQLLQVVEADVQAHYANHLAVLLERDGNTGHQWRAVADSVEVGIDHAGFAGFQRAGQPAVVGKAVGAEAGVGEHRFGHRLGLQLAGLRL
ncbi:hypothetical protein D3C78_702760 [compost metagenome]